MKLLRYIGKRKTKGGNLSSYGEFLCSFCLKIVERCLSSGKRQKSCGCIELNLKHNESFTNLYRVWANIKQRCNNPNSHNYKDYGGRGITICSEWTNSYIAFRNWALNNGYQEGLQINRINNNGNYEPNNCNFVTGKENTRNRRGQKIKNMEIANEIRTLWNTGNYIQKGLTSLYNVTISSISRIINNKRWEEK